MTNHQNKIEKLITELCPKGVESKELEQVCDFQNGFAFKSSLFKDKGLPIIRITNIQNKDIDYLNCIFFDKSDYLEDLSRYEINKGDILVAMSGATTGKIGYFKSDRKFYLNQRVGKFIPRNELLNNDFLFHFLLSKTKDVYTMAGGGAQPNLSSTKLMKELLIPVPPLAVQEEIVTILNSFTDRYPKFHTPILY